ncbi:MAG: sulfotransferase [Gammaproteobacteria bacterium]
MFPDFLVIGAQKSATTWLDQNMRRHPQIWLPPEKEIHYFDLPPIPFIFCLLAPKRSERHWVLKRLQRAYRKAKADPQHTSWYRRSYLAPRNDRWYASLFTPAAGQIAGEVAPQYAPLHAKKIANIYTLMPKIKIIYLLRNPIERMWSQIAMYHSERFGFQGVQTVDEQQIVNFLRNPKHLLHSQYLANLHRWEKHYARDQLYIGFYEEIRDNPAQLLKSIFRFLGVEDGDRHLSEIAAQKIFAREHPPLPDSIGRELAHQLIGEITALHRRFNNRHTAEWLASAERYLAG